MEKMNKYPEFSDLKGKTLKSVTGDVGFDEVTFKTTDDETYMLLHFQNCCESVLIEDINGHLDDLVGSEILVAEESSNHDPTPDGSPDKKTEAEKRWNDSHTWTFYKIATAKGHVVIRWLGTSNGYYSESVDFIKVKNERIV